MRSVAFKRYEAGSSIGGAARGAAEERYVRDLTAILQKLRDSYYKRIVVPDGYQETLQVSDELLKSIESMARLQENVKYPRNVAAGSDLFFEQELFNRRVHLTEDIILRMSRAIVNESWDWDAKGSPRARFDYDAWMVSWKLAAKEFSPSD
jgi:hypothetical protein